MTMLIREGTFEEVLQVVTSVTKFTNIERVESLAERIRDKNICSW
ncbi:hypothetical protein VSA01S_20060 [Vibrio sagamiensis NBRC 104589]|uniref:Uncharacterized protein n=1 Tax=Vibrio sagamiensis NBRC 104589 TaxID=1219064 RepID=A0A511QF21_9VIBR|nr:hypothetical protein VSA01S_20060 [Vibrio sagamiensis NBRC 104589]